VPEIGTGDPRDPEIVDPDFNTLKTDLGAQSVVAGAF
jgi:hypothetical protein